MCLPPPRRPAAPPPTVALHLTLCARDLLCDLLCDFGLCQNEAFRDLFFDEEFPGLTIKKNFDDVWVEAEFWQWVEGPLINGMYVPATALAHGSVSHES